MTVQLLAYAQAISPRYEEDLTLDALNHNDQPSVIQKIEQETQQELAEFEAEFQRRKAIILECIRKKTLQALNPLNFSNRLSYKT